MGQLSKVTEQGNLCLELITGCPHGGNQPNCPIIASKTQIIIWWRIRNRKKISNTGEMNMHHLPLNTQTTDQNFDQSCMRSARTSYNLLREKDGMDRNNSLSETPFQCTGHAELNSQFWFPVISRFQKTQTRAGVQAVAGSASILSLVGLYFLVMNLKKYGNHRPFRQFIKRSA